MLALKIVDVKAFMKKLLLEETFDHFLLLEGAVTTFNTFRIDGTLHHAYYTQEEQEEIGGRKLSFWSEVRPFCLTLIRGRKSPLAFQFSLQLSDANTRRFLSQAGELMPKEHVRGLLLNLRYDGHGLLCTTGISLAVFSMDKKIGHAWDDMVQKFLRRQEIAFECL